MTKKKRKPRLGQELFHLNLVSHLRTRHKVLASQLLHSPGRSKIDYMYVCMYIYISADVYQPQGPKLIYGISSISRPCFVISTCFESILCSIITCSFMAAKRLSQTRHPRSWRLGSQRILGITTWGTSIGHLLMNCSVDHIYFDQSSFESSLFWAFSLGLHTFEPYPVPSLHPKDFQHFQQGTERLPKSSPWAAPESFGTGSWVGDLKNQNILSMHPIYQWVVNCEPELLKNALPHCLLYSTLTWQLSNGC